MFTFVLFVLLVCPIGQFACDDSKPEKFSDKEFTLVNDSPRDERNSLPSLIDVQRNIQKSARQSDSPLPNQQTNLVPLYKSVRRQQARPGVIAEPSASNSARSIVVYDPTDPSRFREIEGPPARSIDRASTALNGQDQAYGSSAVPVLPPFQPPLLPFQYPYLYPGAVAALPVPHNYPLPHPSYAGHPYFPHPPVPVVPNYGYVPPFYPPFYPPYPPVYGNLPNHPYSNQVPPFPGYWTPLQAGEVGKLIRKSSNNSQSKAAKS